MALMNRHSSLIDHLVHVRIQQVIRHAAVLRTRSAVGTSSGEHFADVAPPRIADAQRSVYERFELNIRYGFVDSAYLVNTQFASQHNASKTHITQFSYMFRRAIVALRGSMQRDRR